MLANRIRTTGTDAYYLHFEIVNTNLARIYIRIGTVVFNILGIVYSLKMNLFVSRPN